jgi:hypothetical protein
LAATLRRRVHLGDDGLKFAFTLSLNCELDDLVRSGWRGLAQE